jgi:hypothetical protein
MTMDTTKTATKRLAAATAAALLTTLTVACTSPDAPTAVTTPVRSSNPPAATTAQITVQMNTNCIGKLTKEDVYIDNTYKGTIAPGGTVTTIVAVGDRYFTRVGYKVNGGTTTINTTHTVPSGGFSGALLDTCAQL